MDIIIIILLALINIWTRHIDTKVTQKYDTTNYECRLSKEGLFSPPDSGGLSETRNTFPHKKVLHITWAKLPSMHMGLQVTSKQCNTKGTLVLYTLQQVMLHKIDTNTYRTIKHEISCVQP